MWEQFRLGEFNGAVEFAVKLGLRNPSEPTAKAIALAMLCSSLGVAEAIREPRATIVSHVKVVKSTAAQLSAAMGPPTRWIGMLPYDLTEFRMSYSDVYIACYGTTLPVPNQIPWLDWERAKRETRCRDQRGTGAAAASTGTLGQINNMLTAFAANLGMQQPGPAGGPTGASGYRPWRSIGHPPYERLGNGATLTMTGGAGARSQPPGAEGPPSAEPPLLALGSGTAAADPATPGPSGVAAPKAPSTTSVASATDAILNRLGGKQGKTIEEASGADDVPPSKKAKKAKGTACLVSYADDTDAKKIRCYYRKLNAKSFPYSNKKDQKTALKSAKETISPNYARTIGSGSRTIGPSPAKPERERIFPRRNGLQRSVRRTTGKCPASTSERSDLGSPSLNVPSSMKPKLEQPAVPYR